MILHPAIVALVVVSLLVTAMILTGAFFGVRIIRQWDLASGSEEQLLLERRTYLISTILSYVFAFEIGSLFLFIYTADSLHTLFVGAMCAAGTLYVDPYGYPTLLLKILNVILAGLWLIVNHVDNRAYDYPLIRKKYVLLLILAPLILAESISQTLYFTQMKADVITSCCGSLFSSGGSVSTDIVTAMPALTAIRESIAQTLNASQVTPDSIMSCCGGLSTWALAAILAIVETTSAKVAMACFSLSLALTLSLGVVYYSTGRLGRLFSFASGVFFLVACASFISFISLYFYELPTHHCPFCVLQKEYGYIGYLLYAALLIGVITGLGVGVLMPFRGIASLAAILPPVQQRLAGSCLVAYLHFAGLAIYRMLSTDFTLGLF